MLTQSTRLEKFGFPVVETSVAVTNSARTARTVSLWNDMQKKDLCQMKLFNRNLLYCVQKPSAMILTSTDCTVSHSANSQESHSLMWSWSRTELVSVQQKSIVHLLLQRTQHRIKVIFLCSPVWINMEYTTLPGCQRLIWTLCITSVAESKMPPITGLFTK